MALNEDNKDQSIDVKESKQISLYEEKLAVTRHQKKVGEVIVRKKIETKMIQVPVRQEKLIIERIGENSEQLAEVVINEETVNGFKSSELQENQTIQTTKSNYLTLDTAQKLLDAIANLSSSTNAKIRLEILSISDGEQAQHQSICDRYN